MIVLKGDYNGVVIRLPEPADVKTLCRIANKFSFDIDAISEDRHYVIDAKSELGLYSLDLSKNILLHTTGSKEDTQRFFNEIRAYIIEDSIPEEN